MTQPKPATPNPGASASHHQRANPTLSQREYEVIALVAKGHTDNEIATMLYISVRTVRSHLDRIRDKTEARRRADLTRWFMSQSADGAPPR